MQSQWIHTADSEEAFERLVIARSRSVPVIVDFWAAWCQPCRMLAPALEAAIDEMQGAVELVKVNTEEAPALAARFQIRSIPAVKAFVDGRVTDEFVGVKDRAAIVAFLRELCPSADDQAIAAAQAALGAGDPQAALEALEALQNETIASLALRFDAQLASGDYAAAQNSLEALEAQYADPATINARQQRLALAAAAAPAEQLAALAATLEADPHDSDTRFRLAASYYAAQRIEEALEQLLELVKRDRRYGDDQARKAMLAIFEQLGSDDDRCHQYRRQLQIYL